MTGKPKLLIHLAVEYGLSEHVCRRILLSFGNKFNYKALAEQDGETFVDGGLADSFYAEIDKSNKWLIAPKDIKPRGSISIKREHYLYFLLFDGEIVYIGQSCNLLNRIGTHSGDKQFNGVHYVTIDPSDAEMAEQVNIMFHKPTLNIVVWDDATYFKRVLYNCGNNFT